MMMIMMMMIIFDDDDDDDALIIITQRRLLYGRLSSPRPVLLQALQGQGRLPNLNHTPNTQNAQPKHNAESQTKSLKLKTQNSKDKLSIPDPSQNTRERVGLILMCVWAVFFVMLPGDYRRHHH